MCKLCALVLLLNIGIFTPLSGQEAIQELERKKHILIGLELGSLLLGESALIFEASKDSKFVFDLELIFATSILNLYNLLGNTNNTNLSAYTSLEFGLALGSKYYFIKKFRGTFIGANMQVRLDNIRYTYSGLDYNNNHILVLGMINIGYRWLFKSFTMSLSGAIGPQVHLGALFNTRSPSIAYIFPILHASISFGIGLAL